MSTEVAAPPPSALKLARRNKIAEDKAALREQLAALVNRVPERVNAGSVQTTREWLGDNTKAARSVTRKRISRRALQEAVARMEGWRK